MPWTGISIVILVAALGQAAPPPSTVAGVTVAQDSKTEKLVCKKVKASGSRLRAGRTCLSAQEWEQRTKDDQKALTDMQKGARCSPGAC